MNEGDDAREGVSSDESSHRGNDMVGRGARSNSPYMTKTLTIMPIHSWEEDEGITCERDEYV